MQYEIWDLFQDSNLDSSVERVVLIQDEFVDTGLDIIPVSRQAVATPMEL